MKVGFTVPVVIGPRSCSKEVTTFKVCRYLSPFGRRAAAVVLGNTKTMTLDTGNVRDPLAPGRWDGANINTAELISDIKFNRDGLVPAIAQQYDTGEVLMMAWMNEESVAETMRCGRAVYYSRSRQKLWRKGETSGQVQVLCDILLDCDGDTLLVRVDQKGVACHTGRRSCFYNAYRAPTGDRVETMEVTMDPNKLYGPKS